MKIKTTQPRKQRKKLASLSLHEKRDMLNATLEKSLRQKFKRRNLPVRSGDKARVITGAFKGTEGEVVKVDVDGMVVYIDKVISKKRDGTEVPKAIHPSNIMLIDIDIRDKARQKVLERKVSKSVVETEAKREEARLKAEEEARIAAEKKKKAEEEAKKAEKEAKEAAKEEKKAAEKGKTTKPKKEKKISEAGIDDKTKKDWISGK